MDEKIKRYTASILLFNLIAGSLALYYIAPSIYTSVKSIFPREEMIEPNEPNKNSLEYVIEE